MGVAKKKKTKTSKNYIWKDTKSVSDRLKKGQIPYVDFYPLKTNLGAKKDDYIIIDPKKPINLRADRQDKWENIPEMARNLYDTPLMQWKHWSKVQQVCRTKMKIDLFCVVILSVIGKKKKIKIYL